MLEEYSCTIPISDLVNYPYSKKAGEVIILKLLAKTDEGESIVASE